MFHIEPESLRHVSEVFNPDRFGPLGDDLLNKQPQEPVLSHIRFDRPGLTIISPPCGPFSALQNLTQSLREKNWEAARRYMEKLKQARKLLRFAALVCEECH